MTKPISKEALPVLYKKISENEIVERDAVFLVLYQRHGAIILNRCQKILLNRQDAQDATQEILTKLWTHWKKLDLSRPLLPWILQVTTNHCIDVLRLRKKNQANPGVSPYQEPTMLDRIEQRDLIHHLLKRFDRTTQRVVIYRFLDGFSNDQVADLLGVSEKTVRRKLSAFQGKVESWLYRQGKREKRS